MSDLASASGHLDHPQETFLHGWPGLHNCAVDVEPSADLPGTVTIVVAKTLDADGLIDGRRADFADIPSGARFVLFASRCSVPPPAAARAVVEARRRGVQVLLMPGSVSAARSWSDALRSSS